MGEACEETIIRADGVHYAYPNGAEAVAGVSLKIDRGEFLGIIGQNGSGKTTLVKTFNGLLKPTKGVVLVKGQDTRRVALAQMARIVGYVFQNPDHQLTANSVKDEVAFGLKNVGFGEEEISRRVEVWIDRLGLREFVEEHPFFLTKGQRQLLALASVLAIEPEVVIVDEPTTGMDMAQSYQIMDFLRELNAQGTTIIIISHNMRLIAEYCKRVVVMSRGRVLLDGGTREVFSRPELLRETFLEPPQITQLAQLLSELGVPRDLLSVKEMVEFLTNRSGY